MADGRVLVISKSISLSTFTPYSPFYGLSNLIVSGHHPRDLFLTVKKRNLHSSFNDRMLVISKSYGSFAPTPKCFVYTELERHGRTVKSLKKNCKQVCMKPVLNRSKLVENKPFLNQFKN